MFRRYSRFSIEGLVLDAAPAVWAKCRLLVVLCMATSLSGLTQLAIAAPTWYVNGTGGNNPNIPDFYQHQDWTNGSNGWETNGGWCFWVAYADVFYDLTQQGYPNLYTAGGTAPTATNWYTAMYGASSGSADVATSAIYRLQASLSMELPSRPI